MPKKHRVTLSVINVYIKKVAKRVVLVRKMYTHTQGKIVLMESSEFT